MTEKGTSIADRRIPRLVHYCWFGRNPVPELTHRCLESWRRYMPDWEIVRWDETNYDVSKATYMREAYEYRKWAFVSDYARFDVLRDQGGVYFDTDVELLQPIPDHVLRDEAFTCMEASGFVNPGLVFGCISGHPILPIILDSYERSSFSCQPRRPPETVNKRVTSILETRGFKREDTLQRVSGLTVYPSEYFCGYDQDLHESRVTANTISRHHYAHTWASGRDGRRVRLQRRLKSVIGEPAYRTLLRVKRAVFGVRGA